MKELMNTSTLLWSKIQWVFNCSLLFSALVILGTSCELTDPDSMTNQPPEVQVTAPDSVDLNADNPSVTLDASASTDPDDDDLNFDWAILSRPSNSELILSNTESSSLTFQPDVAGEYVLEVSVGDGINQRVSEQATIYAYNSVTIIEIGGRIATETVLEDIFEDETPDYIVTSNLIIDALVTVEPGVIIQVDNGLGIEVSSDGVLVAEGESDNRITFTSSNVSGGLTWKGIYFNSFDQRNSLSYVDVLYGGSDDYLYIFYNIDAFIPANISISENARISITNCTIGNSDGAGLVMEPDGEIQSFSGNNLENNSSYAMLVPPTAVSVVDNSVSFNGNGTNHLCYYQGSLPNGGAVTWNELETGASILGLGNIGVGGDLTLNPGVSILLDENIFITIENQGALLAQGSSSGPISISAYNAENGILFGGLSILSADSRNSLSYVNMEYGGGTDAVYIYRGINEYVNANLFIGEGAKVQISNCSFSNSGMYGIVTETTGEITSFSSNVFTDNGRAAMLTSFENTLVFDGASSYANNGSNTIDLFQSTVSSSGTINALDNSGSYRVLSTLKVASDVEIEAGAVFEVAENIFIDVESGGSLSAIGTASNNIVFTTADSQGGRYWGGLQFYSSSALNALEHVTVSNAGGADAAYFYGTYNVYVRGNVTVRDNGELSLLNCSLIDADGYGLLVENGGSVNGLNVTSPNYTTAILDANTSFAGNSSGQIAFED